MKKILGTASLLPLLFCISHVAEANFYVAEPPAAKKPAQCMNQNQTPSAPPAARCNTPCQTAWESPSLTKIKCDTVKNTKNLSSSAFVPVPPASNTCTTPPPPPASTCLNKSMACQTNLPPCAATQKPRAVSAIVYEGSLKSNIERILNENGWEKIIWKIPYDYRWVGTARICGPSLISVMNTMTESFPIEVTFYEANHVVTITNRTFHE